MAQRKTKFEKEYYYHIYNRGVNKQNIFKSDANYRFLIRKVKKYTVQDKIAVIAYCLMPNHYHFLFRQDGNISISNTMQAIFNSYTKAFNKMYGRSGTLFEERFKSILVDSGVYITHLCRYIHRNPIDIIKPLVSDITPWHYSNYPEWIKLRNGDLVDHNFIKTYFKDEDSYEEFVLDYSPSGKLIERLKTYYLD